MAEMTVLKNEIVCIGNGVLARIKSTARAIIHAANHKTAKTLFKYVAVPLATFMACRVANATDLAAAGKDDAEATFGADSTMMYYFMLAEVVLVFLLYLRNHNPATFLFIPVFIVATKVIFSIISGFGS